MIQTIEELANDPEVKRALASIPRRKNKLIPKTYKRKKQPMTLPPIDIMIKTVLELHGKLIALQDKISKYEKRMDEVGEIGALLQSNLEFASSLLILRSSRRDADTAKLRFRAIQFLHDRGFNGRDIATFFHRDRTTVIYALRKKISIKENKESVKQTFAAEVKRYHG